MPGKLSNQHERRHDIYQDGGPQRIFLGVQEVTEGSHSGVADEQVDSEPVSCVAQRVGLIHSFDAF